MGLCFSSNKSINNKYPIIYYNLSEEKVGVIRSFAGEETITSYENIRNIYKFDRNVIGIDYNYQIIHLD